MSKTLSDRLLVGLIACVMIIGQLGIDIYIPAMPEMRAYFSTSTHIIQLTLTYYLIGYGVGQLLFGPISDYFGRKPILILGLLIILLSTLLICMNQNAYVLLILRLIQGIGSASCAIIARSILRDRLDGKALVKAMSIVMALWSLTPLIAPIIGSYLQTLVDWQATFGFIFIFSFIILILILLGLPETNQSIRAYPLAPYHIAKNYYQILKNKMFLGCCITSVFVFAIITAYNTVTPFLYQQILNLTPTTYAWILSISSLMIILGAYFNHRLINFYSSVSITYTALVILLLSALILLILGLCHLVNLYVIVIPFAISTLCIGIVLPNTNTGLLLPFTKQLSGSAGALKGALQMLISAAIATLIALTSEQSQIPLAMIMLSLALISLIFFRWFVYSQKIND
ncbi:MAG: Bcr/CflA family efflux MFS transporter [Gammaproteobacteria bacterium]|nr:MAG: Bcr/CflA family efflux MFS transporter [Gammaproteobacteria bacterium]UTW42695.1 multidrug effflux MFS transporter [bacterium SCSIO 12844]